MEHTTPVLVTTEHKGVFFGYLDSEVNKDKMTLKDARNVVYWSEQTRGFLGLASDGPNKKCKVGPKVPDLEVFDITSVARVTDKAVERFEEEPWGS